MEALLIAFSLLVEADIEKMSDEAAVQKLLEILKASDPLVMTTRNGPMLLALLRRYGLVAPFCGQERLDTVDPRLACEMLVEFERFRAKVLRFYEKTQATYQPISCSPIPSNRKEASSND